MLLAETWKQKKKLGHGKLKQACCHQIRDIALAKGLSPRKVTPEYINNVVANDREVSHLGTSQSNKTDMKRVRKHDNQHVGEMMSDLTKVYDDHRSLPDGDPMKLETEFPTGLQVFIPAC
ncbi:MAG TPA: hypothetical protein EYO58_04970 [Flavobacteriales bacterium]|nr:hypothetical protein [Flavobacteriales bacterium]